MGARGNENGGPVADGDTSVELNATKIPRTIIERRGLVAVLELRAVEDAAGDGNEFARDGYSPGSLRISSILNFGAGMSRVERLTKAALTSSVNPTVRTPSWMMELAFSLGLRTANLIMAAVCAGGRAVRAVCPLKILQTSMIR